MQLPLHAHFGVASGAVGDENCAMSRSLASTSVTCQSVKPRSRVAPSGSVILSKAMPVRSMGAAMTT